MRRILISLFLITVCGHCYAQEYFNKRLTMHSISTVFNSVRSINDKYYVVGNGVDSIYLNTNTYAQSIRFSVFDRQGGILRDTFYRKDGFNLGYYYNNTVVTANGNFLFPVQAWNDTDAFTLLICMDSSGHLVWEKEYPKPICNDNVYYHTYDLKPTGTGEWLMLSHNYCTYTSGSPSMRADMLLTKLDSSFNIIWNKTYGDFYLNDWPSQILIQPDGYLLSGSYNNFFQQNNFVCRAELIKVDTTGNELWSWKSDPAKLINKIRNVVRTQDGGYLYCGQGEGEEEWVNQSNGEVYWRNWIEKLDSNRNVVWNKVLAPRLVNYMDDPLVVMKELPDGNIVVAGSLSGGYEPEDIADVSYASLVKLSANGDVIWKRLYNFEGQNNFYNLHDMQQTTDGGFIMVGEATDHGQLYGDPIQRGWIIRVDSNGCEQSGGSCNPTEVATVKFKELRIYPNPANDVLYIEDGEKAMEYRLINITGSTMRSGMLGAGRGSIDMKDLTPGMYILHVGNGVYKVMKE